MCALYLAKTIDNNKNPLQIPIVTSAIKHFVFAARILVTSIANVGLRLTTPRSSLVLADRASRALPVQHVERSRSEPS